MVVYRRIEFAKGSWRSRVVGILAVALGLGLAVALLLLSIGLALVLLPIVVVALLIGRWRWRKLVAEAAARPDPTGRGPVIELDYEVVEKPDDGGREARRR